MRDLVSQLVDRARSEQAVACLQVPDAMQLLAYPLARGALLALGFDRDHAHLASPESVLQRRSADLARFGEWLPAMCNDGSWYVVRRINRVESGQPVLLLNELAVAQELLA